MDTFEEKRRNMKIYDISNELLTAKAYPGDPVPKIEKLLSIGGGDVCNLSTLSLCAHNGTHVDSPYHFLNDGITVENIPLYKTVGYAYVCEKHGSLTKEDAKGIIEKAKAQNTDAANRILIKGDAVVTSEAAAVFAEANIYLLGNESLTVGPFDAPMQVHKILLEKEIVLLENICLNNVNEGVYFLNSAPLKIGGSDGAPCRAILIEL